MNLEHLKYFAEVARQEHVTGASRTLHVSPSAVSHAIDRLEEEFGHPLLSRSGRRIVLTAEGRRLAERAEGILRSVSLLHDDIGTERDVWSTHLRLAATHGLAAELLAPAWTHLCEKHPNARVDLASMRTADIVRAVAAGELDYAVGYSPLDHPDTTLDVLVEGRLVVATRPDHPLMGMPKSRRAERLRDFPHASVKALYGTATCEDHPTLAAWGAVGRVPLYFDSYDVARGYLLHSDGWAVMPPWTVSLSRGTLAAPCVLGPEKLTRIAALWPKKGKSLPEPVARLHASVRQALTELPDAHARRRAPKQDRLKT